MAMLGGLKGQFRDLIAEQHDLETNYQDSGEDPAQATSLQASGSGPDGEHSDLPSLDGADGR